MTDIVPHIFEDNLVRSVMHDDEPWFVGGDVAKALGYRDSGNALRGLDDDEKGTHNVSTLGGEQTVIIVSEAGVFRLIFTSRKPEAERFKRWLAHEVLPSLRRDGHYAVPGRGAAPYSAEGEPFTITMESVTVVKTRIDLVAGGPWAGGRWRHGLRRLAGAGAEPGHRRYPGYASRGTFVPAEHLDFADRPPS